MRIYSYFSVPTDLAAAMSDWPEFVSGEEYFVDLVDPVTHEQVSIRPMLDDGYLILVGEKEGKLYEKVVGRVILELQPNTDSLMIEKFS